MYRKFSYDMLSDPIQSAPAALSLRAASPTDVAALSLAGGSKWTRSVGKDPRKSAQPYTDKVDGSDFVELVLSTLLGRTAQTAIRSGDCRELTNVIQERFDVEKFDVSAYYKAEP